MKTNQLVPYVQTRKLSGGRTGYYFCPPARVRDWVVSQPLGTDYEKAMEKALELGKRVDAALGKRKVVSLPREIVKDTVDDLVDRYMRSTTFALRSKGTQAVYANRLRLSCNTLLGGRRFGARPLQSLTHDDAENLYKILIEERTLYSATHALKILTTLFRWGVKARLAPYNPFSGIEKASFESRDRVWTSEEMSRFRAAVEGLNRPSIALALTLSYDTSRRLSDVLAIQKQHYLGDGRIKFRQIKTKKSYSQPVSKEVAEAFEALEDPEDYLIINEETGEPWKPRTFRKWVQYARKLAKLPKELQWRDIRRTVATELANAGATEDEIMSVTGHSDRRVVGVYVKAAEGRSDNAWEKLQSYRGGKKRRR